MNLTKISIDDIINTIWLTRPDLRLGFREREDDRQNFTTWLLSFGKNEYKSILNFPEELKSIDLDEPMPGFKETPPVPFTRVMYCLWRVRTDLQELYDLRIPESLENFKWWYLRASALDQELEVEITDSQWSIIHSLSENVIQDTGIGITVGMHYLWKAREDLRAVFDLTTHKGRERFVIWFLFHAVGDQKCFAPLEPGLRARLLAPVEKLPSDTLIPISNLMYLFWLSRLDLHSDMDLNNKAGRDRFVVWYHAVAVNEHPLDWSISKHARTALLQPTIYKLRHGSVALPKVALDVWLLWPNISETFPLNSRAEVEKFLGWLKSDDATARFPSTAKLLASRDKQIDEKDLWEVAENLAVENTRPSRHRRSPRRDGGVSLIGFARGVLGIGEDLRMMSRALSAINVSHSIYDIQPSEATANFDISVASLISDSIEYDTKVFVLTGMETARVVATQGMDRFAGGLSVGYWPWEFDQWPVDWRFAQHFVDEIWASTTFTERAYETGCSVPVLHMPMAVELPEYKPLGRMHFGLPPNDFLYIFGFDVLSHFHRKNPWGPVRAFLKAFPRERGVGLVVKLSNVSRNDINVRRLKKIAKSDSRIYVITDTLSKSDWLGLLSDCDAFVSLHRSEGFGRILAEAMLLRKPVIATGFSGNTDFLSEHTGFPVRYRSRQVKEGEYPFAAGFIWANPSITDAAVQMRRVLEDVKTRESRADAGLHIIETAHSAAAVGRRYRRHFQSIGLRFDES